MNAHDISLSGYKMIPRNLPKLMAIPCTHLIDCRWWLNRVGFVQPEIWQEFVEFIPVDERHDLLEASSVCHLAGEIYLAKFMLAEEPWGESQRPIKFSPGTPSNSISLEHETRLFSSAIIC